MARSAASLATAPGLGVLLLLFVCAVSGSRVSFDHSSDGHIEMVTEKVHELRSTILRHLGNTHRSLQFAEFALRYRKKYSTIGEIKQRFNIFVESLEEIESTNGQNLPYKLGVNEFADMTWEEFRGKFLGAAQNCSATEGTHKMTDVKLPESKDWREDGIVSPVKDQGSCGSCWTFSTTGALEAAHKQATGKSVLLSEQQLVDCAGAFNNFGCNGGLPSQAFQYIKYNGGLDTEEAYPYRAETGSCKYDSNSIGAKVANSVNITMGAEDELKHAVGLIRPVSVAFEAVSGFKQYKEGVYTSTTCGQSSMDVNHAVLAVGYGSTEDGIPYWIIKNSWGESWGDKGYFKMEMGKNMCGIATCASYPIVPEGLE
eukprot:TRINITY_DN631_c0_g1_i1.p1 TRINITY_DN631_c0_g1~~TRINITY_DN631_c0_g1_i1.p1  ORF type:complete len:371 (+),score=64.05 TRINITY_DN631_c0_g1_i1:210-1322(+)